MKLLLEFLNQRLKETVIDGEYTKQDITAYDMHMIIEKILQITASKFKGGLKELLDKYFERYRNAFKYMFNMDESYLLIHDYKDPYNVCGNPGFYFSFRAYECGFDIPDDCWMNFAGDHMKYPYRKNNKSRRIEAFEGMIDALHGVNNNCLDKHGNVRVVSLTEMEEHWGMRTVNFE